MSDTMLTENLHIMNRFTIIQRSFFILSLIILFWIIFIIIYVTSRIFIQLISKVKAFLFKYQSSTTSKEKICRAFVISSNQYGSFRPTYIPSPLLPRSDSLFQNCDFTLTHQRVLSQKNVDINLPSNINNTNLLEYYLKSYNPLKINLINQNEGRVSTTIRRNESYDEAPSDTDTRPIVNCYALHCTNKQTSHHGKRYTRLKEQENLSTTISIPDDRLSDCSTKCTSITLPTVMVTDCSDSQQPHTDIIEFDQGEKDK